MGLSFVCLCLFVSLVSTHVSMFVCLFVPVLLFAIKILFFLWFWHVCYFWEHENVLFYFFSYAKQQLQTTQRKYLINFWCHFRRWYAKIYHRLKTIFLFNLEYCLNKTPFKLFPLGKRLSERRSIKRLSFTRTTFSI